jgi:hypothetical protein
MSEELLFPSAPPCVICNHPIHEPEWCEQKLSFGSLTLKIRCTCGMMGYYSTDSTGAK